jgi:hypothetical protein
VTAKRIVILVAALAIAGLLSGCGGGSEGQPTHATVSAGTPSEPPSKADVNAVVNCLHKQFGLIGNYGTDTTFGQPHVVLSVQTGKTTTEGYRVEVFSSPGAAQDALPAAKDYFANIKGPVEVSGSSIVAPASTKFDASALPQVKACL